MIKNCVEKSKSSELAKLFARLWPALKVAMPAVAMLALWTALAYASNGGEEHGGGFDMNKFLWRVANFSLIAAGIVVLYFKFIKGALKKRIDGIEASLAEAKAAREEALTRLADVEARLKDKDAELARLVSVAQENGAKEKALLIEEGEKLSQDIIESAKEGIDAELIKAKDEIRREAALMALELAEKMVRENIKDEDRSRIVEEYIARVGG